MLQERLLVSKINFSKSIGVPLKILENDSNLHQQLNLIS
ncbi:hypothetical protein BSM4216_1288 [Bacillus smithii]|nr:hypothetical protein BSM4216_1288 [Bacillus smithii]